jgi:glycosyltransferase involved in cell wall biosynthesis
VSRRVVHYVDSDLHGGSEQASLELIASLDRSRWKPVLLHHPDATRLADGARSLSVETCAAPRLQARWPVAGTLRLWRMLRALNPAVFHAHLSWPLACRHGLVAAWLARVPAIVATAQLYLEIEDPRRPPLSLRPPRRIIAVSEEVKARYGELGVPPAKLVVVRNGIRVPSSVRPPDPALRAALIGNRPEYLVLTPARLHEQKGHAYLLAAAARVPDATFVFAGAGPLREELERESVSLGVADRCVFLGDRADVPDLLAAADLVVLPSLFEGLPVVVLEAMAAGRPVVATSIGGTDEAVAHEVTGLLVPPRDPGALAAAIGRIRSDPELGRRMGEAGRERVEREFTAEATACAVMRVYDDVLSEAEGCAP